MPWSHARSMTAMPWASSTASKSPASGAVPSPNRLTVRAVRPRGTRSRGFNAARLEVEDERHAIAALAAEVMGDRRHRRHLCLPALIQWAGCELGDRAFVVVAFDVVEEVEPVAKDDVLRDADAAHPVEDLGPNGSVIFLVALFNAGFEVGVQADLHGLNNQGCGPNFEFVASAARCVGWGREPNGKGGAPPGGGGFFLGPTRPAPPAPPTPRRRAATAAIARRSPCAPLPRLAPAPGHHSRPLRRCAGAHPS